MSDVRRLRAEDRGLRARERRWEGERVRG